MYLIVEILKGMFKLEQKQGLRVVLRYIQGRCGGNSLLKKKNV